MTMCKLPGCNRVRRAMGYCRLHYIRWKKHGAPGPVGKLLSSSRTGPVRRCLTRGCPRKGRAGRGLCEPCLDAVLVAENARAADAASRVDVWRQNPEWGSSL